MAHLNESKTCEICAWSFTPKRSDAVCCNATCRSKKRRYRAIAVERLTTLADEFNCTPDELIDWYQNDMTDVARLPIADIRFIVGDYIENHKTAIRNDPMNMAGMMANPPASTDGTQDADQTYGFIAKPYRSSR